MARRTFVNLVIFIVFIINVVLGISTFYLLHLYNKSFIASILAFSIVLFLIYIIFFITHVVSKKGIKNAVLDFKIRNSLERNLISIGAFYNSEILYVEIFHLPRIKIDLSKGIIWIKTDDLKIRKTIENYKSNLSSALPNDLVVEDCFISSNGSEFIIRFKDERINTQKKYGSIKSYLEHIKNLNPFDFEVDNSHIINLVNYPHFCIVGSTGSGKTVLAQNLIIQFLDKGFDVSIFDIKKSYSAFADYVDYETEPSDIVKKLKDLVSEMKKRQNRMSEALKLNPRALATDFGYNQKIILIEEYIGLKSMLEKDELKEFERAIKELSVLARSVNISLFVVSQSVSVDLIDSAIKNNLYKIFLGHLSSNIAVSTFGNGVDIPEFTDIKAGYGYIQLDRVEQIKVPYINYSVNELEMFKKNDLGEKA